MVKVSKKKLWVAIRKNCLDCMGGSSPEVAICTGGYSAEREKLGYYRCELYPYRFGRVDPEASKLEYKSSETSFREFRESDQSPEAKNNDTGNAKTPQTRVLRPEKDGYKE